MPGVILGNQLNTKDSLVIILFENLHWQELDPFDEVEAYAELMGTGMKVSAMARFVGKDRPYTSHALRLFRLHSEVKEAVRQHTTPREARVSPSRARAREFGLRR